MNSVHLGQVLHDVGTTDYTDNGRLEKHTTNVHQILELNKCDKPLGKTCGAWSCPEARSNILIPKDPETIIGVLFRIRCIRVICGPTGRAAR